MKRLANISVRASYLSNLRALRMVRHCHKGHSKWGGDDGKHLACPIPLIGGQYKESDIVEN